MSYVAPKRLTPVSVRPRSRLTRAQHPPAGTTERRPSGQRLSGQRRNPQWGRRNPQRGRGTPPRGRPIGPRREPQRDNSPTGNPTAWRPGALLNPPGHAELTSNTRTAVFCAASSTHPHISNAAARALSRFFSGRNALGPWSKSNNRQRTVLLTSLIKQKRPSRDSWISRTTMRNSNICRVIHLLRRNKMTGSRRKGSQRPWADREEERRVRLHEPLGSEPSQARLVQCTIEPGCGSKTCDAAPTRRPSPWH